MESLGSAQQPSLRLGSRVRLTGLERRADLNGCVGFVKSIKDGRACVKASGSLLSVRFFNLAVEDVSDRVEEESFKEMIVAVKQKMEFLDGPRHYCQSWEEFLSNLDHFYCQGNHLDEFRQEVGHKIFETYKSFFGKKERLLEERKNQLDQIPNFESFGPVTQRVIRSQIGFKCAKRIKFGLCGEFTDTLSLFLLGKGILHFRISMVKESLGNQQEQHSLIVIPDKDMNRTIEDTQSLQKKTLTDYYLSGATIWDPMLDVVIDQVNEDHEQKWNQFKDFFNRYFDNSLEASEQILKSVPDGPYYLEHFIPVL